MTSNDSPTLAQSHESLDPPRPFLDTPRESAYGNASNRSSYVDSPLVDASTKEAGGMVAHATSIRRKLVWALGGVAALAVILLAILLPLHFTGHLGSSGEPKGAAVSSSGSGEGGDVPGEADPASPEGLTSGGNGTMLTLDSGEELMYINPFGGYWAYDPEDLYGSYGKANEWTPALNETWTWGQDRVFGVNLGGLFVLEPFIVPALFQKYDGTVDEWTLYTAMAGNGNTEQDFIEMVGAGLNWIRLPIPYWAIQGSVWDGEPFPDGLCWKYILRVISWARKYGIRVNIDVHAVPGSQNGYNHSGKLGQVNFLNGAMGMANAQRLLEYNRILMEFFAQEEYRNVVVMFGIINEPLLARIGRQTLNSFFFQSYSEIRNDITGVGEGHGPYVVIHDGFGSTGAWVGTFDGADRMILDTHPYFAFSGSANNAPIATGMELEDAGGVWPLQACNAWGPMMNRSNTNFGVTVAGEFSCGYNDCGLFVRGVGNGAMYGGDCSLFEDASQWNATLKAGIKTFIMASMDSLNDWFFWTWKIGNSTAGHVQAPLWSYKLGLLEDYVPRDPRTARGASTINNVAGAGAPATALPTYTATAAVPTLTASASFSDARGVGGGDVDGWYATGDNAPAVTAVAGCVYPDPWDALEVALPATTCDDGTASTITAA
ncbi:glycoside hydrolase family 5 protein [Schizophyllum amplum]|uniref:glucan 1,3-beta-glucosidase n=1 Tax=Schizophyllum amplum TaxID=97359 RepID=A0A550CVD7_9AGAR|nr:glycoside hydrolase family 5 protein [Auriculariopsis ampla]